MNENTAREEICRIGASLFGRGYVHSTAGNISVRLEDGYLITPTDACLGFLDPAGLSRVDLALRPIAGPSPSKTLGLHHAIYKANAQVGGDARCVIHTHSTHLVAQSAMSPVVSISDELLLPITPYFVMKVGRVPHLAYTAPGDQSVLAVVESAIARNPHLRAVMLERLGPIVWQRTASAAMALLEELEETARLFVLSGGRIRSLSEIQISELRKKFSAHW